MQIVIRKPIKGQKIKSEELSITAKVVDVLFYDQITAGYTEAQHGQLKRQLFDQLGHDYKSMYFEAVVKITYANVGSDYKRGETAVITWDEFQRCKIIDKR